MGAGPQSDRENEEGVTSYRQLIRVIYLPVCCLCVRARCLGPPYLSPRRRAL